MAQDKVLLADDVDLFLELEKTFFRREDVQILVARTGLQAVEIALAERPRLVLMDLYMPEMDGDEACRRIKTSFDTADIPVIIVTQGGRDEDLERCREAGCDDILLKPIDRHLFVTTARKYLSVADRTHPRAMAGLKIHFGVNPAILLTNYAVNLSAGGVFLKTEDPLPVNTPLSLEFLLPSLSEPVCCQGRVAWVNAPDRVKTPLLPAGMGVQFLDLTNDYVYALSEFIKQQCLKPQW